VRFFAHDADDLRSVKMYGSWGIVKASQFIYRVEVAAPKP
jgi:hypothetical protein